MLNFHSMLMNRAYWCLSYSDFLNYNLTSLDVFMFLLPREHGNDHHGTCGGDNNRKCTLVRRDDNVLIKAIALLPLASRVFI